ncbi:MAG: hypothetical protein AB3N18_04630 [Allomuricauda sp.]
MKKHQFPRYTICTDETMWTKTAVESGLRYHVYDRAKEDNLSFDEQGGRLTTAEAAREKADELNTQLKDPYTY